MESRGEREKISASEGGGGRPPLSNLGKEEERSDWEEKGNPLLRIEECTERILSSWTPEGCNGGLGNPHYWEKKTKIFKPEKELVLDWEGKKKPESKLEKNLIARSKGERGNLSFEDKSSK